MMATSPVRFDPIEHDYTDLETGETRPHITQMLVETGWVDPRWFTPDGQQRGTAVHSLTASYDLGALELQACVSRYRPYLLGHAKAMAILKPEILSVEEARLHSQYRFAGRPDRVWRLYGALAVADQKTGGPEKSHAIQLALQCILESEVYGLPPEQFKRYAEYLTPKGSFTIEEFTNRRDFDVARDVIRRCCK